MYLHIRSTGIILFLTIPGSLGTELMSDLLPIPIFAILFLVLTIPYIDCSVLDND